MDTPPFKYAHLLTEQELRDCPVWRFTNRHESTGPNGDQAVEPVTEFPVTNLSGAIVATDLVLASGQRVFGAISGIYLRSERLVGAPNPFVLYKENRRFPFRRLATPTQGTERVAEFLALALPEIFPIRYDISHLAAGLPQALRNEFPLYDHKMDIPVRERARIYLEELKRGNI